MTTTDWRTLATEANQQLFADAQGRLDDCEVQPDGTVTVNVRGVDVEYTAVMRAEDEKFTGWYDRNVLAAAQEEFERRGKVDEFHRHWPEPVDGARIEWEDAAGTLHAAYRQDQPEHDGGSWYRYGCDSRWTWERLVREHRLPAGLVDVAVLVDLAEVTKALRDRADTVAGYDEAYRHAAAYLAERFEPKEGSDADV